jgi:hypothetical protein
MKTQDEYDVDDVNYVFEVNDVSGIDNLTFFKVWFAHSVNITVNN